MTAERESQSSFLPHLLGADCVGDIPSAKKKTINRCFCSFGVGGPSLTELREEEKGAKRQFIDFHPLLALVKLSRLQKAFRSLWPLSRSHRSKAKAKVANLLHNEFSTFNGRRRKKCSIRENYLSFVTFSMHRCCIRRFRQAREAGAQWTWEQTEKNNVAMLYEQVHIFERALCTYKSGSRHMCNA